MIKKILLSSMLILVACFAFTGPALAEDFPVLEKQVKVRQAHLEWKAATQEIGMETVIEYINEISDDAGAVQLSSLLNDFKSQTQTMQTFTTHVALNNALRELRQTTTDFRLESRDQMKECSGKVAILIEQIQTALAEKESELDSLKNTYWEVRKSNSLEIFDIRINHAQEVLDTLSNGYDITAAQAKLDEIKGKRGSLESALDEKDHAKIHEVHLETLDLSKELRQIVKDLQVEIPKDKKVEHWINVGDRIVERTDTIISELETLEIDTATLRDIHSQAQADIEIAHNEFNAGNLDGAITALEDLKTTLIELRDAYQELIFGGILPADMEVKIEATISVLDDTVGEMKESIGN